MIMMKDEWTEEDSPIEMEEPFVVTAPKVGVIALRVARNSRLGTQ